MSSDQRPASSARPASEWPRGPGNISGNSVRTEARQRHAAAAPRLRGGDGCDHARPPHTISSGGTHRHPARRDIHHRHRGPGERHQHSGAVAGDLQAGAGAVIMHRRHRTRSAPVSVDRRQPDQVGKVEFVLLRRRQAVARHVRAACWSAAPPRRDRSPSPLRHPTISRNLGDALAHPAQREPPPRVVGQRPVARSALGGSAYDWSRAPGRARRAAGRSRQAGCGRLALSRRSAAAAAALARSCAFFFGADFTGCSRHAGIGASPALPRNRATRSVATRPGSANAGCARPAGGRGRRARPAASGCSCPASR